MTLRAPYVLGQKTVPYSIREALQVLDELEIQTSFPPGLSHLHQQRMINATGAFRKALEFYLSELDMPGRPTP